MGVWAISRHRTKPESFLGQGELCEVCDQQLKVKPASPECLLCQDSQSCSSTEGRRQLKGRCTGRVTAKVGAGREHMTARAALCGTAEPRGGLPRARGGSHPCRGGSDHSKWDEPSCHDSAWICWSSDGWRQSQLRRSGLFTKSCRSLGTITKNSKCMLGGQSLQGACTVEATRPPPGTLAPDHTQGEIRIQLQLGGRREQNLLERHCHSWAQVTRLLVMGTKNWTEHTEFIAENMGAGQLQTEMTSGAGGIVFLQGDPSRLVWAGFYCTCTSSCITLKLLCMWSHNFPWLATREGGVTQCYRMDPGSPGVLLY